MSTGDCIHREPSSYRTLHCSLYTVLQSVQQCGPAPHGSCLQHHSPQSGGRANTTHPRWTDLSQNRLQCKGQLEQSDTSNLTNQPSLKNSPEALLLKVWANKLYSTFASKHFWQIFHRQYMSFHDNYFKKKYFAHYKDTVYSVCTGDVCKACRPAQCRLPESLGSGGGIPA